MLTINEKAAVVSPPPRIISYTDYHVFLRDFYLFKKAQNSRFSYRRFAALSGIKSSNFLLLVMKNQRRLSPLMAKSVANAMKLTKAEADYFVALVKLEQCESSEERLEIDKDRDVAVCKIVRKIIPSEKSEYLSVWYYPLIRELAFLPDFKLEAKWISEKLNNLVSQAQAEKAIEILFKLGLWKLQGKSKIVVSESFLDTGPEEKSFGPVQVIRIHQDNLRAWAQLLPQTDQGSRELGLLNIPMNSKRIPEFKKRVQKFQDEIIGWLQDDPDPTEIVQLGTYLIPITKNK